MNVTVLTFYSEFILFYDLGTGESTFHRFTVSQDSLLPSTATCSVGSDAQTLSLYFWASLPQHTAEGLMSSAPAASLTGLQAPDVCA